MRTNRIYEIRLIVAGSRTFHDYKLAKETYICPGYPV